MRTLFLWTGLIAYAQVSPVAGHWQGTLNVGPAKLRLAVHISANDKGELTSTLDSLDQNARGLPVSQTTFFGNRLHLEMPSLRAQFDGTLSTDQRELRGTFTQGAALPLTLTRVEQISEVKRPQEPKPPFPYNSEDVSYEGLAGTLTLPRGAGPFPAVILITGSGPQDRDEAILGHKPFLVLADYLTRRNIAVLRADDRGVGQSKGNASQQTLEDKASDVLSGVEFLKGRKDIDARHIGVLGHSEGGIVGPMAALRSRDISFVVMLAGPGVSMDQGLYVQAELVMRSAGAGDAAIRQNREIQTMIFTVLRSESDPKAAADKMRAEWQKMKAAMPEALRRASGSNVDALFNQQLTAITTPAMRSLILSDPSKTLRALKVPVLALNGSRDLQVSATQNLPAIEAALKAAGNTDFSAVSLPGLNHLFQKCDACTIAEYGDLEETISPNALAAVGDWIQRHLR